VLKASKAKATGKRATAEYKHTLCTAISRPTAPRYLRWAGKTRKATFCCHKISATTKAVTTLRTVTAVTTSNPWLKAVRAATWLAPIMKAISRRVPKAAPLKRAGVVKAMPSCCGV
jgi:hypothetical protein